MANSEGHGHRPGHLRAIAAGLVGAGLSALVVLAVAGGASGSPPDPNEGHKVTICHATSSATNPFTVNTVDVSAGGLKEGHENHSGDIIPPFTYVDKDGDVQSYSGKNMTTTYGGVSGAAVLANGCEIPEPTVDVCPNIEGDQATVPDGLVVDGQGNCVEPTPPPVDVCPNIDGDQDSVPSGMYVDGDGNCVERQDAQDVCPNIDGDQDTVPAGMFIDGDGNCVEPTTPTEADTPAPDVCPNIDGLQATVPTGYELVDGACVAVTTGEAGTPAEPDTLDGPVVTDADEETPEETIEAGGGAEPADGATTPTGDTVTPAGELPFTGGEQDLILGLGIALVLFGIVLEFAHRRRPKAAPKD